MNWMKAIILSALTTIVATMKILAVEPAIYAVPLKTIDGQKSSLQSYEGKVLLLVNVASKCGLTPQYAGLEALQKKYEPKGFAVIGFPCNDFGAQEPGTAREIKTFCSSTYSVTFPLMDKIHVKGTDQHPLYALLTGKDSAFPGEIKWNFTKFIIDKKGSVLARFEPATTPDNPDLIRAIEKALGTP